MPNFFQIQSFTGIEQQMDGALLPVGSARDARNCCTWDGDLSVAKGYVHHIETVIPGNERILKLIPLRGTEEKFYVVTASKILAFKNGAWSTLHTFDPALTTAQIGYVQTMIGTTAYLLVGTGNTRIHKIKLADDSVTEFGAGEHSFSGTVFFYNAETRTITLDADLNSEAVRHILIDGIVIAGKHYKASELESYSGETIILSTAPETVPAEGDAITVRGGGSEAHCTYIGMYYGRLFAAGDPSAPSRLYWSAIAGDGRTVEDWLSVDGSVDASGGYVEVGNESSDPIVGMCALRSQILIFKRLSTWRMYGDRPSAYTLECVEHFSEGMSNASVVVKFSTPYFLTMSGLKTINESGVADAFGGTRYLKEFLPTLHSVSDSRGAQADNRMYFTCKVGADSIYDDTVLEMDFSTGAIMIRDGFTVADMTARDGRLFIIDGERYVCRFNEGTDYAGSPINAYWKTQPTDLGAKYYSKRLTNLYMRCDAGEMEVTARLDGMTRNVPRKTFGQNSGYINITMNADWARVFSIEITNKAGSHFHIRGGIDVAFEKELR